MPVKKAALAGITMDPGVGGDFITSDNSLVLNTPIWWPERVFLASGLLAGTHVLRTQIGTVDLALGQTSRTVDCSGTALAGGTHTSL
jgi:hypothetical protein